MKPTVFLAALLLLTTLCPALLGGGVTLPVKISFQLNVKVYDYSDYGEPPQIAVWLERGTEKKVLSVTRRTAQNDWHGKVKCPVSLPYWASRFNAAVAGNSATAVKMPDGVSCATPKEFFAAWVNLGLGEVWECFVEVNVAGDYNRFFPSMRDDGIPDSQGNGQPSLVYKSHFKVETGTSLRFTLIGRTEQLHPVNKLNKDLSGITSAADVLQRMVISVGKKRRR